jgi:hypothetical protein
MDTRFWGPSGWRLLHLISWSADALPAKHVHEFLRLLPFVLPCKYCRASLTDYFHADPIPTNPRDMPQWMYRIHNCVNNKLRDQKLLNIQNPTWEAVKQRYGAIHAAPCTRNHMVGWDFLFSVAYTTPGAGVHGTPMPNVPPAHALHTPELRNRWSVISRAERLPYIDAWWDTLQHVLPYKEWRAAWRAVPARPRAATGRAAMTKWLYEAEKAVCKALNDTAPHTTYTGLCSELNTFTSGCGKSRNLKMKTCRATKHRARRTLKHRRRTTYKATGGFL